MPNATHYAVNPTTGERLALINGQWVPATNAAKGAVGGAPKLTEGQAKDGFNAKRMMGAGSIINPMEAKGYDAGVSKLVPGFLPGADDKRKYEAASNEWADSMLRLTTGAAATKEEVENTVKTYFPQLGDSPAVRQQKAAMRARVEQDAMARAGPGGLQSGTNALSSARKMPRQMTPEGRARNALTMPTGQAAPQSSGAGWEVVSVK